MKSFVAQLCKSFSLLLITAIFFQPFDTFAQDATVKKLREDAQKNVKKEGEQPDGWIRKGLLNINLSQGSTSNWAAGADKFTFATNLFFNYQALYKKGKNFWDNNLDVNYGLVNTTSTGFRKNDDRFDYLTKYGRQLDTSGKWFFSILGNFRTQLTDGYRFFKSPTTNADTSELTSSFMAPANILLSPGIDWKPNSKFSLFASPASSRWIVVSRYTSRFGQLYALDPGKTFRYEIGGFLTANLNTNLGKNITYRARLDLFSNYRNNPQNVDIFCTNLLAFKVNKWLQVTYNLDVIYDDDALQPNGSKWGTQIKSLLGVGFAASL
jgi:hypothetical protein